MEFDKIEKSNFLGIEMEYGFVYGNEIIFLIKVGQDGLLKGYDDKYINLAHELNQKYGFSIIVSSNHFTGPDPLGNAMDIIKKYQNERNFNNSEIYYMGYSNGGLIGAWYLYKHPEIKNALLVNAPIMTNLKMFINGLDKFDGDKLVLVYGDKDFSYKNIPFLLPKLHDKISLEIIKGADHYFANYDKEFHDLSEKYLFDLNNLLERVQR